MPEWLGWTDRHPGAVALLSVAVAVVSAAIVWIIYRRGLVEERGGILDALERELGIHESWIRGPYIRRVTPPQWFERNYKGIVYKLSIVAVDAAIAVGPSLFLNRRLLPALIGYRQRVIGFNQLIDRIAVLQGSPELYRRFPSRRLIDALEGSHAHAPHRPHRPRGSCRWPGSGACWPPLVNRPARAQGRAAFADNGRGGEWERRCGLARGTRVLARPG